MDAFAVSLGVGTTQYSNVPRSRLRLAFHFGIFQAGMPVIGWLLGTTIARLIQFLDHWIALALLAYVGVNMIRSGLQIEQESHSSDPSKGKNLVVLSVATSIDALAVGLSLAMIKVAIITPALIIGIITFGLSMVGLFAGNRLGVRFGKRMEIIGGLILIGIGLRILFTHLFP
jgi:putative Mn2+ efflux pump MntP